MNNLFILTFQVLKPYLIVFLCTTSFKHLNRINNFQNRTEQNYNRCNFTFLHTLTCYFQIK